MEPDLERGVVPDKTYSSAPSTVASNENVLEERIPVEAVQETTPDTVDKDIQNSAQGVVPIDASPVQESFPTNESKTPSSSDIIERASTESPVTQSHVEWNARPPLVNICGLLDEDNRLAGNPPFLSPEELGLSEPSHGIFLLLDLFNIAEYVRLTQPDPSVKANVRLEPFNPKDEAEASLLDALNYGVEYIDGSHPDYELLRDVWDQALLNDFIENMYPRMNWTAMLTRGELPLIHDVKRENEIYQMNSFESRIRQQERECRRFAVTLLYDSRRDMYRVFTASPHSYVVAHELQRSKDLHDWAQTDLRRGNEVDLETKMIAYWKDVFCISPSGTYH